MKRIVILTDFSGNARNASIYAIRLFGVEDAEYTLFNVYYDSDSDDMPFFTLGDLLENEAEKELDKEKNYLLRYFSKKLKITTLSSSGLLTTQLNELAKEHKFDYVVMGLKGESAQKRDFIGSNTIDVIRNAIVPVIAVPDRAFFTSLSKIGVAVDKGEFTRKDCTAALVDLAMEKHARLDFIHVETDPNIPEGSVSMSDFKMIKGFNGVPHEFHSLANDNISEAILNYAHDQEMDMLVLISKKNSLFDRLIHRSLINEVVMLSDIPLFAIHDKEIK